MQYWYFLGFIPAVSGGRRMCYPQGLLQAVELQARSVVSAGAAQWQTHRPETYRDENTQACSWKREINRYMRLWTFKKKKKKKKRMEETHLRHQSTHSMIVAPIRLHNCVVILRRAPLLTAPANTRGFGTNPTLSCPNQIKTCWGMTPNAVRKKKKNPKNLKDMEQIIGIQSDVIKHAQPTFTFCLQTFLRTRSHRDDPAGSPC